MMLLKKLLAKNINTFLSLFNLKLSKINKIELDPIDGCDDYEWDLYHKDYAKQIKEISQRKTQKLNEGDFKYQNGKLSLKKDILPMNKNHICLYEVIGILRPKNIIEIGCGGGDHLHNIGLIFPSISKRGFDRSNEQINFLGERSPHIRELVSKLDITMPPMKEFPEADLVYSQAVLMHIQSGNSHLVALSNMFLMAKKAVVLMENFKRHNFLQDIQMLYQKGMILWDDCNFYVHRFNNKPSILIVSRIKLKLEKLENYNDLIDSID